MRYKGCNIVDTMLVRRVVTELICDVVVANAGYMHQMMSKGLPLLLKALETGGPKKEIKRMLKHIDERMSFIFALFHRHSNFLKPLKTVHNI